MKNKGNEAVPSFRWAVGIEGSVIPHLGIDQYKWTQHDRRWRQDFELVARDLKCRWMRYSLPWHEIEPRPGQYQWKWVDERLKLARELGIELIVNLAHFGTPTWLPDAFGDVDFPRAFENFLAAFGRRYAGAIRHVCPINEPMITALFCGDAGLWPPNGRNYLSYMTVLSRIVQGLCRSIQVLRQTMPGVEIVLCDALETARPEENWGQAPEELRAAMDADVEKRRYRRHLVLDLCLGRVDAAHPLYAWLRQYGFSAMDLNWLSRNRAQVDVLGLDYYAHTEVEVFNYNGTAYGQRKPATPLGLYYPAKEYWERYRIPLMVTETSAAGSDEKRLEWLKFTVSDVRRLRQEGIPVLGYTWWPVIDHLDWDGALLHQTGFIHPVGIYRLERKPNGDLERVATPLRDAYEELVKGGDESAGALAKLPPVEAASQAAQVSSLSDGLGVPLVVHSHLSWEGVWQRPQQFLSRLSKKHRVLFVEGPRLVNKEISPRFSLRTLVDYPNITVMQTEFPASRFHLAAWVDQERFHLLREALKGVLGQRFSRPVQWFYDPMAVNAFAGRLGELAIVYDCMDELSQFKFAPPELVECERRLLSLADLVFAGGKKLHEAKSRLHPNCHFYGCGVDHRLFAAAMDPATPIPPEIDFARRPILGWFGVVDERLDYELVARLADANENWSVAMVGPVVKVDPNQLPRRDNLYWLGVRPYAQLPALAKAFSVCIMPFALNEATEFINPTKALEYLATGRPVVSTPVPDVVSLFSKVVRVAGTHQEFIDRCAEAAARPDEEMVKQGLELARRSGWDETVEALEGHLDDVLRAKAAVQAVHPSTIPRKGLFRNWFQGWRHAPRHDAAATGGVSGS